MSTALIPMDWRYAKSTLSPSVDGRLYDSVFTANDYIETVKAGLSIKAKYRKIVTEKEQYILKETKITYSSIFLTY